MDRRIVRGKLSVICGITAFYAAVFMSIICIVIFAGKYTEIYLESLMTDYITESLVTYLLSIGAAFMFAAGGIRYIKGNSCRGLAAVGGVMLTGISVTVIVIAAISASKLDYIGNDYVILTVISNIMPIIMGIFIVVFSLAKVKGAATLVIGYSIAGFYAFTELLGVINYLMGDVDVWGLDSSFEGIVFTALDGITPFIIALGTLLLIPYALYIPSSKKAPVYGYPPYTPQPAAYTPSMYDVAPRPMYHSQPFIQSNIRPSVFNEVYMANQRLITDFLESHGYTVKADEESLSVVKVCCTEDTQNCISEFVAKSDGIYSLAEVFMGGYDLRKRLNCPNPQTARMILLAKYVMEAVRDEGNISALHGIGDVLGVLTSYENSIVHYYASTPNFRNMYILEDYFDLIDIKRKIYFMR